MATREIDLSESGLCQIVEDGLRKQYPNDSFLCVLSVVPVTRRGITTYLITLLEKDAERAPSNR